MMASTPNLLSTWLPLPAVLTAAVTVGPMLWWVSNQARDIEEARAEAAAATEEAKLAGAAAVKAQADALAASHKASLEAEGIKGKLIEIAANQQRQELQIQAIHQILIRKAGGP